MSSDRIHDAVLCAERRGRTPARSIDAAIVTELAYGCNCRSANGNYCHSSHTIFPGYSGNSPGLHNEQFTRMASYSESVFLSSCFPDLNLPCTVRESAASISDLWMNYLGRKGARASDLSPASLIPKSRNCFGSTSAGDCDMRSMLRLFFGNAITSRMLCSPQISITRRSKPNAIPPCGGAPSRNARSKWPNCASRASGADAERFEHFVLQRRFVDSHAAAADLHAVQHNVISLGANLREISSPQTAACPRLSVE